jgi:glycosyltransferase involved in cell wall biosynthesis
MKASIVICTYNRSGLLEESIRSLLKQDFSAGQFEIIVVDNNSADNTRNAVQTLAAASPVKIAYVFEGQQGLSHARNAGIRHAGGEIVVFTDDDIEAEPSWLVSLISAFNSPDVACAGGPIRSIWPCNRPEWLTDEWLTYLTVNDFPDVHKTGEFRMPNYPFGANIAFRKDVFQTIGLFPANLGRIGRNLLSSEEITLCRKIWSEGKRIAFAPDAVIYHKILESRLRKMWFYHRTYWQGRSDALLDVETHAALSPRRRYFAADLSRHYRGNKSSEFTSVCHVRAAMGYIYQSLASVNGDEFRRLRALRFFLSNSMEAAVRERDVFWDGVVQDREKTIADRDQKIREIIAAHEREIAGIKNSRSWKLTAPLRWLSQKLRKGPIA